MFKSVLTEVSYHSGYWYGCFYMYINHAACPMKYLLKYFLFNMITLVLLKCTSYPMCVWLSCILTVLINIHNVTFHDLYLNVYSFVFRLIVCVKLKSLMLFLHWTQQRILRYTYDVCMLIYTTVGYVVKSSRRWIHTYTVATKQLYLWEVT